MYVFETYAKEVCEHIFEICITKGCRYISEMYLLYIGNESKEDKDRKAHNSLSPLLYLITTTGFFVLKSVSVRDVYVSIKLH